MIGVLKTVGMICLKGGARLIELGTWTYLNQLTGRQLKERGDALYKDINEGATYYGKQLKIIKND